MFVFENALPALEFPSAKMAGLNFVEQQEQLALVAKFSQSNQIFRRRNSDSAFALHRFNQNRSGLWCDRAAHRFKVVKRHLLESLNCRAETFFHFFLSGRCNPSQRPPMKRVDRRNDFVADVIVSEFPGQLEQAFVRFRAAVAEKDSPRRDKVDNPFRQPPLELIII